MHRLIIIVNFHGRCKLTDDFVSSIDDLQVTTNVHHQVLTHVVICSILQVRAPLLARTFRIKTLSKIAKDGEASHRL